MTARTYKLDELAHAAGMSARTVRYYVQRGLLPAPTFRGKDTAYEHEHLVRLRAITRLQVAYYPLDAIAAELDACSPERLQEIAEGTFIPVSAVSAPPSAPSSPAARTPKAGAPPHRASSFPKVPPGLTELARGFHRVDLFPGVELTVADDAPDRSLELVKEMLQLLEAKILKERNHKP